MIEPSAVQLFKGLGRHGTSVVLAAAVKRDFKASQVLIRPTEPASRLFLIETGWVDYFVLTENGREILLRRLSAGNVFGVAAFLSEPTGYLGMARTACEGRILVWEHRVIRQLAQSYPRLTENALRTALRYLALYAKRHIGLVSNVAQDRLACALSSVGSRIGHALPSGVEVAIKNEDLASLADVSIFTASRLLKDWERKGAVEKSRGKVLIRCPEKLLAA